MRRKTYERNRKIMPGFKHKPVRRKPMSISVTEKDFKAFEDVRRGGLFNMFDPRARELTDLSKEQWVTIMRDYDKLKEAWSKKDEN